MALEIEECIKYTITNASGITDIIGTRYYPMNLPQNTTYPALTYTLISGVEHHDIDYAMPSYQFSCWAKTYAEVKTLAKEIKSCFQRRNEPMGGSSGLRIVQGVHQGDMDLYDAETEVYHIPITFTIIYQKL